MGWRGNDGSTIENYTANQRIKHKGTSRCAERQAEARTELSGVEKKAAERKPQNASRKASKGRWGEQAKRLTTNALDSGERERGTMMRRIWRERQAGKQTVSNSTEHYARVKRFANELSKRRRRSHARAAEECGGEPTSASLNAPMASV